MRESIWRASILSLFVTLAWNLGAIASRRLSSPDIIF